MATHLQSYFRSYEKLDSQEHRAGRTLNEGDGDCPPMDSKNGVKACPGKLL